jgi:hypothetical protein
VDTATGLGPAFAGADADGFPLAVVLPAGEVLPLGAGAARTALNVAAEPAVPG